MSKDLEKTVKNIKTPSKMSNNLEKTVKEYQRTVKNVKKAVKIIKNIEKLSKM